MADDKSTIKISLQDGVFEVSGSEKFVNDNLEKIEKIISTHYGNVKAISNPLTAPKNISNLGKVPNPKSVDENKDLDLGNVFDFNGDEIRIILKTIPGDTKPKQTANVAILYLFGLHNKNGEMEAEKKVISKLCKHYGCLDESNFAAYIKKEKQYLVYSGGKIRVTQPGLNKAEDLIREINEAAGK